MVKIKLNKLEKKVDALVGDELLFRMNVQESVGFSPQVVSFNEKVLKLIEKKVERSGMSNIPGSDEGDCIFVFEVVRSGETELIFHQTYRGEIQQKFRFVISVR
tara:strand:- start:117 stop:428 length:312 start_codon:yes stop_codon:yes gene_type:complete